MNFIVIIVLISSRNKPFIRVPDLLLICDLSGSQIGKVSQVERSLNRELAGLSPKLHSTTKRMLYFSAYEIILKSILILILSIQPPHLLISMYGRRAPDFRKEVIRLKRAKHLG